MNKLTETTQKILEAATRLRSRSINEFTGFQIAMEIKESAEARCLIGYGTLYRALYELERQRSLYSRWEDPDVVKKEGRLRRRYYRLKEKETNE